MWQQPADPRLAATPQRPPGWAPVPQPRPADRPPPDTRISARRGWWRRPAIVIPAALLTVAVIAAAIVITSQQHKNSNGPQITLPTGTRHREPTYGPQVRPAVHRPQRPQNSVAVDTAGDLYVIDNRRDRVLKLAARSSTQSVVPFTGISVPYDVAVDDAGNLYVTDSRNNQVLTLAAGSSHPDGAAVHRPQRPQRCGGGHRRQPLRQTMADRVVKLPMG